jgi:hypothetical protein
LRFAKVRVGIQVLWDKVFHHIKRDFTNANGTLTGNTHLGVDEFTRN